MVASPMPAARATWLVVTAVPYSETRGSAASLILYGVFVFMQTVRHRDYFLPVTADGEGDPSEEHADPPTPRTAMASLGLLMLCLASIGLTIPSIAVVSLLSGSSLALGLGPLQMVLLALTVVITTLTVAPGRATLMQGTVHLVLFGAFLFLAVSP